MALSPATPTLPGSMAGSPAGPGASPVMSPGAGAGNQAAARGIMKSVMPTLHKALMAFPVNSPEYKAVLNATKALAGAFGKAEDSNIVPASILQMANAAKTGQSPIGNAAPPLQPSPPPDQAAA